MQIFSYIPHISPCNANSKVKQQKKKNKFAWRAWKMTKNTKTCNQKLKMKLICKNSNIPIISHPKQQIRHKIEAYEQHGKHQRPKHVRRQMPTPSPLVTTDCKTRPGERAHVRNPLHVSSSNEWPAASCRRMHGSSTLHPLFPPVVHAGRLVQEENYASPTCKPRQFKKGNRIIFCYA